MDVKLLDIVALTVDLPAEGLSRGLVGTVVEVFPSGDYEVGFTDEDGRTVAQLALQQDQIMVLHHTPV